LSGIVTTDEITEVKTEDSGQVANQMHHDKLTQDGPISTMTETTEATDEATVVVADTAVVAVDTATTVGTIATVSRANQNDSE